MGNFPNYVMDELMTEVFATQPKTFRDAWAEFSSVLITEDSKITYKSDESLLYFSEERLLGGILEFAIMGSTTKYHCRSGHPCHFLWFNDWSNSFYLRNIHRYRKNSICNPRSIVRSCNSIQQFCIWYVCILIFKGKVVKEPLNMTPFKWFKNAFFLSLNTSISMIVSPNIFRQIQSQSFLAETSFCRQSSWKVIPESFPTIDMVPWPWLYSLGVGFTKP